MNPITHGLSGWVLANVPGELSRRDRAIVVVASLVPDLDGAGVILDIARGTTGTASSVYAEYHHILCHNLGFGVALALAAFAAGRRRMLTAGLAFAAFLLHIAGDVAGSRGPEGEQWEIPFLWPFSDSIKLAWSGQWALDSWVNVAITTVLLMLTFWLAWRRGYSPLELAGPRVDAAFVGALRNRFGTPR